MKKKPYIHSLKERLKAASKDRIYNFLLSDGKVRGAIVHSTLMINEMRTNHNLGPLETLILGHAYIATSLMSANLKKNDRISMQIQCSGPIKGVCVEANSFGEVRGYLKQNPINIDKPLESLNMSSLFGPGFLCVTKYIEDSKQPFTGQIILEYGNIAQDIANYFLISEQIPTAFNLSINFNQKEEVIGAGGLFLQAMPNADDETVKGLENLVDKLPSIGQVFANGVSPADLINQTFDQYSPKILADHRVEFFCYCNEKVIKRIFDMIEINELQDIIQKGPFPLETICHNCNTIYALTKEQLEQIYNERIKD